MALSKKYIKFGLRADKSLGDLLQPKTALTNIINNLDSSDSPIGFEADDLLLSINGIQSLPISESVNDVTFTTSLDLKSLDQFNFSFGSYIDQAIQAERQIEPTVTLKDLIDNAKVVLGDPVYGKGGRGPIAKFIPSSIIKNSGLLTENSNGDFIYTDTVPSSIIVTDDFWENGYFTFSSNIHPSFGNSTGGIQWEGYISYLSVINVRSTGLFIVEQDIANNNNWEILANLYSKVRTLEVTGYEVQTGATKILLQDNIDSNGLIIPGVTSQINSVVEGDVFTPPGSTSEYNVIAISRRMITDRHIIVEGEIPSGELVLGSATFTAQLGRNFLNTSDFDLIKTYAGDKVKTRITLWWPDDGESYGTKKFYVDSPELRGNEITFAYFYADNEPTPIPIYTYEFFKENIANMVNRKIDNIELNKSIYVKTSDISIIRYKTPRIEEDVVRYVSQVVPHTTEKGLIHGYIPLSLRGGVKLGDWIAVSHNDGTGVKKYAAQIKSYPINTTSVTTQAFIEDTLINNQLWYSDATPVSGGAITLSGSRVTAPNAPIGGAVEGIGCIGIFEMKLTAEVNGRHKIYPVTGSLSIDEIAKDYLFLGLIEGDPSGSTNILSRNNSSMPYLKRFNDVFDSGLNEIEVEIANAYSADTYALPTSDNGTDTIFIAVYSSKGLEDLSIRYKCEGTYGKEVAQVAFGGSSTVTLKDVFGISTGDYVQFGLSLSTPPIPFDTEQVVGVITPVTVTNVNTSTNTITLSYPLQGSGAIIGIDNTIVFVKSYAGIPDGDRESCILPLNTAPPFTGTDTGLRTTSTYSNLRTSNLSFKNFTFYINSTNDIVESGSTTYNKTLNVYSNGVLYKVLTK